MVRRMFVCQLANLEERQGSELEFGTVDALVDGNHHAEGEHGASDGARVIFGRLAWHLGYLGHQCCLIEESVVDK